MATIGKHKTGFRAQICVNGVRESKIFETKSEAKAWASRRELELRDTKTVSARMSFADLADAWVKRYAQRPNIEDEKARLTALLTVNKSRPSTKIGDVSLPELSKVDVATWRDRRLDEVSAGSVRREWNLLSKVCTDAVGEMGLLSENPFLEVVRPDPPDARDRVASDDELKLLEASAITPSRQQTVRMFLFAVQTGMSLGELCALTWDQIDGRVAHLPKFKTRPARDVPLTDKAMTLLGQPGEGRVFKADRKVITRNWRRMCDSVGIDDLNFHDARHMAATWMSKKIDVLALAKLLGHSDSLKMLLKVYYKADAKSLIDQLQA